MEDSSFIYRSMYAAHIRIWLRLFPPSQLLVMAPDSLLQPGSAAEGMRTLARFAGLPESSVPPPRSSSDNGPIRDAVLTGVHENGRKYLLSTRQLPPEPTRRMIEWLQPHQCDLASLLRRHRLLLPSSEREHGTTTSSTAGLSDALPWLRAELESAVAWEHAEGPGSGVCEGVSSVDEWFVGSQ